MHRNVAFYDEKTWSFAHIVPNTKHECEGDNDIQKYDILCLGPTLSLNCLSAVRQNKTKAGGNFIDG